MVLLYLQSYLAAELRPLGSWDHGPLETQGWNQPDPLQKPDLPYTVIQAKQGSLLSYFSTSLHPLLH